jgi:hypothetical protein
VKVLEQRRATCDALVVVLGRARDRRDHARDALGVGAAKLAVLEVDVVNDLCDGAQTGIA